MELLLASEISIPFFQIMLLVTISTLLLLFRKIKCTLLTIYLFTFYWGFRINLGNSAMLNTNASNWFILSYIGFGLMIVVLALFGFFRKVRDRWSNMSFYCSDCDGWFPFFLTKNICPFCGSKQVNWIT
jgi:hypothetical protein